MPNISPASLSSRKKYSLGDFVQYATGKHEDQYAAVADLSIYKFADKAYLDENNTPCRQHMLLVGHYWRKSGGRPAWAHATGTHIRYYSGEGIQVNPLIQDIQSSKVYYGTPFDAMSGVHDSSNTKPRMTTERKLERALVESVINFIFLKKGHLVRALDLESPDMLGSFRLACRNFAQYQKMPRTDTRSLDEELLDIQAENAAVQEQAQFIQGYSGGNGLAFRSGPSALTLPAKRSFVDMTDSASDDASQGSNKRSSPLESAAMTHEAEIYAGLEQEVQALRAKLEQQEAKIDASETEVMRQKAKRRTLRTQRDEWKEKYITQQGLAQIEAQGVKQEEGSEDWKGMLFEQERKTEHYKLKYIALKEEKKVWTTQVLGQEKVTTEPEDGDTSREPIRIRESEEIENSGENILQEASTNPETSRQIEVSLGKGTRRDMRSKLIKYWDENRVPERWADYSKYPSILSRRHEILTRLYRVFQGLLKSEKARGVDMDNSEVRRTLYKEAVEQMDQTLQREVAGIAIKGQAAAAV
ncbi:uncharacterized protein J4E79_001444 [Alternaria viburni]|uniref:uncharacterized protein n=1 Tax=Alternaria viburni TaxID=566460 RepID=UPI0020C40E29|nr:uncharacterized protein J4E79_001444 [Alternaria viburni]KAI4669401.1 hypothetical protein J4E79_001444 [Alternaria viburni]